jgi:L-alanine-DL-glutamate epimerase-like enolase superfamily enzyme
MNIQVQRFTVAKRYPLTISRGTSAGSENLLVTVEHDGVKGIGEMAPTSGGPVAETADTALLALERWTSLLADVTPWEMQRIETLLSVQEGEHAALCALDCALHDWQGKRLEMPVWKLLGLDLNRIPPTSLTIGINPPDVVRERVPEILARTGAKFLKVKLGNPAGIEADKESFAAAQEAAAAYRQSAQSQEPLGWRVDANGGWNVDDARAMLSWLAARSVEFVEQPLPRGQEADLPALHRDAPLPLYVDESIRQAHDIPPLANSVDGVNLKLMKCGGLREALRIIHTARAHGLKVMIGCMSETSLAITAAAHLGPLVDALDLDSHLNLNPDPFVGAMYVAGRVVPTDASGLGVHQRNEGSSTLS